MQDYSSIIQCRKHVDLAHRFFVRTRSAGDPKQREMFSKHLYLVPHENMRVVHLLKAMNFFSKSQRKVYAEVKLRMLKGSEFQTVWTAMLNNERRRLYGHIEPTADSGWQNAKDV